MSRNRPIALPMPDRGMMVRLTLTLMLSVSLSCIMASWALAAEPKTSLPDIEDEVMCVSCNVALNIAESPQAYRQREFIRDLVDDGLTKRQVKARLVDEYGPAVLAMPPDDDSVGVAAYLVPIAVFLAFIATAAVLLPRWRGRTATAATGTTATGTLATHPHGPAATDAELQRLDDDLQRFDRG